MVYGAAGEQALGDLIYFTHQIQKLSIVLQEQHMLTLWRNGKNVGIAIIRIVDCYSLDCYDLICKLELLQYNLFCSIVILRLN